MAFKVKNPFINKHTTNSQRTLGRDGRVISPLKQDHDLDPRDLNMRPIYSEVLNKGQDATLQDVSKLPDPRTAEEYDASFSINPNLNKQFSEWEANNPNDIGILDKVIQVAYNNPGITNFLTKKFPKLARGAMDLAMQASGGGADAFNLNDAVNKYFGKRILSGELSDEDAEDRELYPAEEYTGSYRTEWRPEPLNINKAFLGDIDPRLTPSSRTAKSEIYPWMKSYSVKGNDFDKNLDVKDVDPELYSTQVGVDATDEEWENVYDEFANRTRRQNMPFFIDHIMSQTPEYKEKYADKSNIDLGGYFEGVADKNNLNNAYSDLYKGKTFYGSGDEDGIISRVMGVDYGGLRAGLSTDNNLPYASVQDVFDFNVHGKGGYDQKWGGGFDDSENVEYDPRSYQRAQLLNRGARALGGCNIKLSDRFYFTPDEYRDYIPEEDIEFMQEFYNIHDAGGGIGSGTKPMVINASKKKK